MQTLRRMAAAVGGLSLSIAFHPQALAQDLVLTDKRPLVGYSLTASNGYSVQIIGEGNEVSAVVEGHHGLAFYEVTGKASATGIWATFGSLGRVAMRFTPTRIRRHDPPPRCEGRQRIFVSGFLAGTFEFRGEGGYTHARARRARGNLYSWPRWKCKEAKKVGERSTWVFEPDREQMTLLDAFARRGKLHFVALRSPHPFRAEESALFAAGLVERRGRMKVSRSASVSARPTAFLFDERLNEAIVKPPRPFTGEARFFKDEEERRTWKGSLSVSFPGAEAVRLAGRHFQSQLYRRQEGWPSDIVRLIH